eukprot:1149889-Pelagomonas_calceolata.AAC.3
MDCLLQTVHLCLLKHILGVKRTTPNWSVLRECGYEPLQFHWFCAAVGFYNALLRSNSTTLSLDRCNTFTPSEGRRINHHVRSGQPIVVREFVIDLRKRLRGVWNADALADHGEHTNKTAKYHHWMALPLRPLFVHGAPFSIPRSTLSRQIVMLSLIQPSVPPSIE